MTDSPRTFPRLGLAATAAAGIALCLHVGVGWLDAGRPQLRPTGHLSLVAAAAWISATVPALLFALLERRNRAWSLGVLGVCLAGHLLILR